MKCAIVYSLLASWKDVGRARVTAAIVDQGGILEGRTVSLMPGASRKTQNLTLYIKFSLNLSLCNYFSLD